MWLYILYGAAAFYGVRTLLMLMSRHKAIHLAILKHELTRRLAQHEAEEMQAAEAAAHENAAAELERMIDQKAA